jgi:hypothetical protein
MPNSLVANGNTTKRGCKCSFVGGCFGVKRIIAQGSKNTRMALESNTLGRLLGSREKDVRNVKAMTAPAVERFVGGHEAGSCASISEFAEALEAKATALELTGSGGEAVDLRKWATELRHKACLYDFVHSGN